jgi:hypothetical protein
MTTVSRSCGVTLPDVGRRLGLGRALVAGLALAVVACGGQPAPSTAVAGPTPTPTAQPVTPIGSGPLVIDPRLLHALPDEVAGVIISMLEQPVQAWTSEVTLRPLNMELRRTI